MGLEHRRQRPGERGGHVDAQAASGCLVTLGASMGSTMASFSRGSARVQSWTRFARGAVVVHVRRKPDVIG